MCDTPILNLTLLPDWDINPAKIKISGKLP